MQRSARDNEKHAHVSNKEARLIKHSAARSLRWRLAPAPGAKQIVHQPSNQCGVIYASAWRVRTCVQAFIQCVETWERMHVCEAWDGDELQKNNTKQK